MTTNKPKNRNLMSQRAAPYNGPSSAVKLRVLRRDRFTCQYCGALGHESELQIDHIVPVSKGGSHHIGNLCTSCRKCNMAKGSKSNDQVLHAREIAYAAGEVDLDAPLFSLSVRAAMKLITSAVLNAQRQVANEMPESPIPLSLNQVRMLARRSSAHVRAAARNGALKAEKSGGKAFKIDRTEALRWIAAGCPEKP